MSSKSGSPRNDRRALWLCVFVVACAVCARISAAQTPYETAARNFLSFLGTDKQIVQAQIIESNTLDPGAPQVPVAYHARLEGGGYLMVALSKDFTPVKAYSLQRDFERLPPAYRDYLLREMEAHARALSAAGPQSLEGGDNRRRWDFLLTFEKARSTLAYAPDTHLLTTRWNQDHPYNKFLPEVGGRRALAGCVNTAVAQLMKYHGHPARGTGVVRYTWNETLLEAVLYRAYHWENMPDSLNAATAQYQADETALLIRDLAVLNKTSLDADNSATAFHEDLFARHLGYSTQIAKMGNADVPVFFNTLRGEIDALRPVLLEFPGHMTVADGYADDPTGRKIHVNFGWGGQADDYYYLDETVEAGDYSYPPSLNMWYAIAPCTRGVDCYVNLEAQDGQDGLNMTGRFDHGKDVDRYEVYLNGVTHVEGNRGYANQAFFFSLFGADGSVLGSQDTPLDIDVPAGKYAVEVSLCNLPLTGCYTEEENSPFLGYTVSITTGTLTEPEKQAVDQALDVPPVLGNAFRNILMSTALSEPYRIRIDARDKNGDPVTLGVSNTNPDAVAVGLSDDVLSLTPVPGAGGTASSVTVTASANGETAQGSFVVLVLDQDVAFGKEFTVSAVFADQDDVNTHRVILDGPCTITGFNGYVNQGFFSWVEDGSGNTIVNPGYEPISHAFSQGTYLLGASLRSGGSSFNYVQGVHDTYRLEISCPDADDSVETIAALLGIDLSGTTEGHSLTVVLSGAGHGTVTSIASGIDCGTDCSQTFPRGAQVGLTAQPASGSCFSGWVDSPCVGTGDCTLTVEAPVTVTALFSLLGDVNGDGDVDLADALTALQVQAGRAAAPEGGVPCSVGGEGRIGLEDILYVMQRVAGLR